jgi:hypothetical protein
VPCFAFGCISSNQRGQRIMCFTNKPDSFKSIIISLRLAPQKLGHWPILIK